MSAPSPLGVYTGDRLRQISFPLGGIGSGCIGLAGSGRLIDWEIFNRPNKGRINGYSHFAVKAERDGRVLDARVLNGDLATEHTGELMEGAAERFGFGPQRGRMAGAPHMEEVTFRGEFPLAHLEFACAAFPGAVAMTAFNPFIPLDDRDSSIPAAFFEIRVRNTDRAAVRYTVAMSLSNPAPLGASRNAFDSATGQAGGPAALTLSRTGVGEDDPARGDLCVATDAAASGAEVWAQECWFRGAWFDSLEVYWREFAAPGPMPERRYSHGEVAPGRVRFESGDTGTLGASFDLAPGAERSVRFVISWSFPNFAKYWASGAEREAPATPPTWKNYYATLFEDSAASAGYALQHWDRLYGETLRFKEALYGSSLPPAALEAAAANLAVLKTPTCLRLTDGSFYGFEGLRPEEGCCEGSCTHVWNYAYALPFLFPKLERSMRDLDFHLQPAPGRRHGVPPAPAARRGAYPLPSLRGRPVRRRDQDLPRLEDLRRQRLAAAPLARGEEVDRVRLGGEQRGPLGRGPRRRPGRAPAPYPGHGTVRPQLLAYRLLPRRAQGGRGDGAASRRGGDRRRVSALFQCGRRWVDEHLFNGSWYHQRIDVRDRSILERFLPSDPEVVATYWNEEAGEIKYQIAEGSEIDQLNAQWHANLCGLGDLFDPEQRRTALRSLYRNNFKSSMRDFFNACRVYCMNGEGGLVISDWPQGTYRPVVPLPYAGETQNGYEYQAAILMIQEGLVEEGLSAVAAIRDRYDGARRNPWNEFECGSNYARSMAAWSLIPTFSGFEYDMVHGMVGFDPLRTPEEGYRTVWSLDSGWGTFAMAPDRLTLALLAGALTLSTLRVPSSRANRVTGVTLRSGDPEATATPVRVQHAAGRSVVFPDRVTLAAGQELVVECAT